MTAACPMCGAKANDAGGGRIKCPSCGYFGANENEQMYAQPAPDFRPVSTGEEVFERNINAVLEVNCPNEGSAGSGFMLNAAGGYALTNAHVILSDGRVASRVTCRVAGNNYEVSVLAVGDMTAGDDLALLQLSGSPYGAISVRMGDSDTIKNGSRVYVIGNSKGDGTSITSGIVSDRARKSGAVTQIMTDAAVNPGNSGGPMFSEKGELIGVVVAKRNNAEGMAYAIPVNQAKKFISAAERRLGKRIIQ